MTREKFDKLMLYAVTLMCVYVLTYCVLTRLCLIYWFTFIHTGYTSTGLLRAAQVTYVYND